MTFKDLLRPPSHNNMTKSKPTLCIIGLGYVGLPLAVEFGKHYPTLGYDFSESKIESYRRYCDPSGEVSTQELQSATQLKVTHRHEEITGSDYFIVAVPTPVDMAHQPDFSPLIVASRTVGQAMRPGATVVYESTVYPGATEEICIPILEKESGLRWKEDFHVGYSPERVNPGDRERTITKVMKVVSGDDDATLNRVAALYATIITAGVHRATSIKVAEAAKVIENTQRDLNIALMNELAIIFDKIGIDTLEVLEAAGTKWNFLPFRPGLVGGHCIGVDPYYLTHKAEMLGYLPQVILAGRRINDSMSDFVVQQTIKQMIRQGKIINHAKVVVLGLTFKENCSDLRNSKVAAIVSELGDYGCEVLVHDPLADAEEAYHEYGIRLTAWENLPQAQAVIAAVSHHYYLEKPLDELLAKLEPPGVFIDIKSAYPAEAIRNQGHLVWRL